MQCYFSYIFIDNFLSHLCSIMHNMVYNITKTNLLFVRFLCLYEINYDESMNCYYLAYTTQPVFRNTLRIIQTSLLYIQLNFPKLSLYIFSFHFTIYNIQVLNIQFKIIYFISYGLYFYNHIQ